MWRKEDAKPQGATPAAVTPSSTVTPPGFTNTDPPTALPVSPRASACIAQGIRIKGEVTGKEDLFLDGTLEGKLDLENGTATVGPNGKVKADISAREVIIRGQVEGKISASERVQLWNSGRLIGEVRTDRLSIEDGATLRGYVEAGKAHSRAEEKSSKHAASESSERLRNSAAAGSTAVVI